MNCKTYFNFLLFLHAPIIACFLRFFGMRASMTRRTCLAIALLLLLSSISHTVAAQDYPLKAIRLIVGFPPGGAADILARVIAQKLGESLRQQVIVENRPGAATLLASETTAKAAPDGYTLFIQDIPTHAINATLYKKLPYDPVKDFAAVALVAS